VPGRLAFAVELLFMALFAAVFLGVAAYAVVSLAHLIGGHS
jgi:hypothetical protein